MSTIEINPAIERWLDSAVFSRFESEGILVTVPARRLISYVIQAQPAEDVLPLVRNAYDQVVSRIETEEGAKGTFFENALAVYMQLYPSSPRAVLNVNRAVRLLTVLYVTALGRFPCGPTGDKGGEGGSSEGGGQDAGPSIVYPGTAGSIG
jgi:hypothetical protein